MAVLDFQLTFSTNSWRAERLAWRAVIQLNLVRSVNAILDILASEMASSSPSSTSPPSSPRTRPVPDSQFHSLSPSSSTNTTNTPRTHDDEDNSNSNNNSDPDPDNSNDENNDSADRPQFTAIHALLKLRLAPLKHVEADLRRKLGAATDEVSPAEALLATPFDPSTPNIPASPVVHSEFGVRANRSWRDVLHSGLSASGFSKDDKRDKRDRDNTTDVIAGCRDDINALWRDEAVKHMLRMRNMRVEEAPGLCVSYNPVVSSFSPTYTYCKVS